MKFLGLIRKKFLGIDVGTSTIKLVELSSWAGRRKLENYGEISASVLYKKPFRTFEKNTLLLSTDDISRAIKAIIQEAGIKSRKVVFSIPDFSSFFTSLELPPMTPAEIPQAVRAEARRHVPLPLGEVVLDWEIIKDFPKKKPEKLKVLLVAVPNEVINQYQKIAKNLELELLAMEAEVFGLIRALVNSDDREVISLVDIGTRSTTCSIIDRRALKVSRSFDISGNDLIERVSKGLSVDYETAEKIKNKYGISSSTLSTEESNVRDILVPLIDLIVREINKILTNFYLNEKKEVKKIILSGGVVLLPGLLKYFQDYFQKQEIEIANPFSKIYFPPILDEKLAKMGPSYAIAVGAALRGLE
jgi:type IV pilus assembly protein PilM